MLVKNCFFFTVFCRYLNLSHQCWVLVRRKVFPWCQKTFHYERSFWKPNSIPSSAKTLATDPYPPHKEENYSLKAKYVPERRGWNLLVERGSEREAETIQRRWWITNKAAKIADIFTKISVEMRKVNIRAMKLLKEKTLNGILQLTLSWRGPLSYRNQSINRLVSIW